MKMQDSLLLAGFLFDQRRVGIEELCALWEKEFGESLALFSSKLCPMKKYYSKEMLQADEDLSHLQRFWIVGKKKVQREALIASKKWALQKEEVLGGGRGQRFLNIDTGLITPENLILATIKNFTHRIYLGEQIFADLTLVFEKKSYRALEWTYPDYQAPEAVEFFNWCRQYLLTCSQS